MITKPNVKINLGLNVLRKREDGFHDLETLFVPYFGISDTLEIITGDDYSRTSAGLFATYGEGRLPESQGSAKPEGVFGVETEDNIHPTLVQGISEDGKLMITIAPMMTAVMYSQPNRLLNSLPMAARPEAT